MRYNTRTRTAAKPPTPLLFTLLAVFAASKRSPSKNTQARKRQRRRDKGLYNLTVEIDRDIAERVFAPEALRKLGYLSKSDFVRQAVTALADRLSAIEAKEKADGAGTPNGKNN